jgi:DNA excision repair protein ERCC-4
MDASAPPGQRAHKMLTRRLRLYLWWKAKLGAREKEGKGGFHMPQQPKDFSKKDGERKKEEGVNEALRRKDVQRREQAASRRRVRGGAPAPSTPTPRPGPSTVPSSSVAVEDEIQGTTAMLDEAEDIADFFATQTPTGTGVVTAADFAGAPLISMDDFEDLPMDTGGDPTTDFDAHYGLLSPSQTILVRSYTDDADDRLLSELKPRFIVLFEPSLDFVRRIEVYRSSNPGLNVRVYFMVWQLSCEEHKFLAGQRREKDAFERLIRERGVG